MREKEQIFKALFGKLFKEVFEKDMLPVDELNWIRQVLSDYTPKEISPSYYYLKMTEFERNNNKGNVRKELDALRKKWIVYAPEELIELRKKNVSKKQKIENFTDIYIINNFVKDIFYIGQVEKVFDRAYKHFVTNPAENKARYEWTVEFNLPKIYDDYRLGDKFNISLIPLEKTSFSSLNEFEDNAIRAYNSLVPYGYNRVAGNIRDKAIFENMRSI